MRAPDSNPAIVLGAGDTAATLLKELAASREWHVVALLDDDTGKLLEALALGRHDARVGICEVDLGRISDSTLSEYERIGAVQRKRRL